ncbi:hypothetical protein G6L35_13880 [Agrobacterium tumefaciens]|uniref:hypothetical protein n=1 Tax=Agrobacterium tumefaciens TaxID=358 RepID=UPI001573FA6F|nr:hypothetical protein [Agrobacterium tumefaciens]NSZ69721.1 hypothetical protein [Agrobacterium tumefaciens]
MKNGTLERSAPVLTLAFTGVWFGYSLHDAAFPWEPVVVGIGAFIGWVVLDHKSLGHADSGEMLHPHDKTLGGDLRALFDQRTLRFLTEQPFGQPFRADLLSSLEILADGWNGTKYEFEEARLDNLSAEIVRLARKLCNKLAEYAGVPARWPEGYLSVPLDSERAEDLFSDRTWERIRELRTISSSLKDQYEKFEREFRRLAPEEYKRTQVGS